MPEMESTQLTYHFDNMPGEDRLKELILYIADQCSDDPRFGATKLNKILYFSDFISFRHRGVPITGVEYMRINFGPAPKRLVPVRDAMIQDGQLAVDTPLFHGWQQRRLVPQRPANLDLFSAEDISIVDRVIRILWESTGKEVSELSHGLAWQAPEDGQSIPYEATFLSDEPLDEDTIAWAQELIRENAWAV